MDTTNIVTQVIAPSADTGALAADFFGGLLDQIIAYTPKLIGAFIFIYLGLKLTKIIVRLIGKLMTKRKIEQTVVQFVQNITSIVMKVLVILTFVGILGIPTSSFIAVIGAAGLAVGLALQGSLQNFAGGVIILILRPYSLGDFIDFGGEKGTVVAINIFNTVIEKPTTNENVIIPNGTVAASSIINWRKDRKRRVETVFGIAYGEDIAKARAVVTEMALKDERILQEEGAAVIVSSLGDSSVNLELRTWCRPEHYFDLHSDMLERVYNALNENKIEIPFPQLDVNLKK